MFTSVAILQLYEKGKIELDKPIGLYLPNFRNKLVRDSVTVHQLLTHTSGFYNLNMESYLETNKLKYKKNSDFIQLFINDSLVSRPGEKYNYSTTGFIVLGLIVEAVTNKSYYNYLKENVFIPSKMMNTTELEVDSIVKNKASGYTSFVTKDGSLKKNDYYLFKASSGGFHYSTADDLYNFFQFLMNNKLLKKETVKLMFEPKVKGYNTYLGYGIDVDKRYNQIILGHSGGWYGVRCEVMFFSKDNYTIVILSNIDDNGKTGTSMVSNFFKELIAIKKEE